MGHQVFIIARVKARGASHATYRFVAGYRHHYCDGDGALEATLRFLHVLKQPDNADVIREEIRALDGNYGAPGKEPEPSDMPCGFLSTVLAASWDAISEGDRLIVDGTWLWEKVVSVKGDVWPREGDGATVLDIMDFEQPHCSWFTRDSTRPRGALAYLQKYYPDEVGPNPKPIRLPRESSPDYLYGHYTLTPSARAPPTIEELTAKRAARRAWLLGLVDRFRDIPSLTDEMLAQTWPGTFRMTATPTRTKKHDGGAEKQRSQVEADESIEPHKSEGSPDGTRIPSLVDLTLRDALKQGIDTGDLDKLESFPWLAERADVLAEVLHEYSPFPDAVVPLLVKLIQGWKRNNAVSIDLSGFNITDSQLETILPELDGVRTLNLSRNPSLTTTGLELVLERFPHLRRLLILSCPGIDDCQFTVLWVRKRKLFGKLDALYWELLHRQTLQLPPELSLMSTLPFNGEVPVSSVMLASPAVVVQTLTTFWKMFEFGYLIPRGRVYEIVWSLPMTPDQTWDERGVLHSFLARPWWTFDVPYFSWMVVVNPFSLNEARPKEWGFFPYQIIREEVQEAQEKETPESAEKTGDAEGTQQESEKKAPKYEHVISVGQVHTLREYLSRLVDEDGKVPAPPEAVEQLEALTNRMGVRPMGRETVMKCLFHRG